MWPEKPGRARDEWFVRAEDANASCTWLQNSPMEAAVSTDEAAAKSIFSRMYVNTGDCGN